MTPMTPVDVTDRLLHELVGGSHAEGTTCLAVAAVIEHHDQVLLVNQPAHELDETFSLPVELVLPGLTLLDALHCTVTAVTGLDLDQVTGYLGHHDTDDGEIIRMFCFTVTVTDPLCICRTALVGHWWADPDDLPNLTPAALATWTPLPRHRPADPPLAGPLRASARGLHPAEAGTELLIRHRSWLHRDDFTHGFVHTSTADGAHMAAIDWPAAITALDTGHLPCSSGEAAMLRLAASLADGTPVNLCDVLTGLDTGNTQLVSQAVLHATDQFEKSTIVSSEKTCAWSGLGWW